MVRTCACDELSLAAPQENTPAGCSKKPSSKAEAYPLRYVEDLDDARTPHGKRRVSARRGWAGEKSDFFSILLVG